MFNIPVSFIIFLASVLIAFVVIYKLYRTFERRETRGVHAAISILWVLMFVCLYVVAVWSYTDAKQDLRDRASERPQFMDERMPDWYNPNRTK